MMILLIVRRLHLQVCIAFITNLMNKNILQQRVAVLTWLLKQPYDYWGTMYRMVPYAAHSMRPYGGNWGILTCHLMQHPGSLPLFVTFNNVKRLDFDCNGKPKTMQNFRDCIKQNETQINHIKKGAQGCKIVFFKGEIKEEDGMRYYDSHFKWTTVFSISQCDGIGVQKIGDAWTRFRKSQMSGSLQRFQDTLKLFATHLRLIEMTDNGHLLKPQPTINTDNPLTMSDYASNTICAQFNIFDGQEPSLTQILTHIYLMVYAQLQMFGDDYHLWIDYFDDDKKPITKSKSRRVHLLCLLTIQQLVTAVSRIAEYQITGEFIRSISSLIPVGSKEMAKLVAMDVQILATDKHIWDTIKRSVSVAELISRSFNEYQQKRIVYAFGSMYANEDIKRRIFVDGTMDLVAPEIFAPIFDRAFPMIRLPKKL